QPVLADEHHPHELVAPHLAGEDVRGRESVAHAAGGPGLRLVALGSRWRRLLSGRLHRGSRGSREESSDANERDHEARRLARESAAGPMFEEVLPAASGITWVHDNAMSADRYLPETMGPGVAFLDYDNDGWLDIFMVNSGASDFYKPAKPLKNALYKNNRNGT